MAEKLDFQFQEYTQNMFQQIFSADLVTAVAVKQHYKDINSF